ncbi:hypothetical protein BGI41_02870 [Methanobrevibacter sp. 87.7]|uniref:hypothetical protein n=1 Tax=Methanobrevibacter sp. 87.7 TaxID=387957 RepID=UPI000B5088D0|nr:hypothetical protein [Methanobrevibacter sp. 87.7]OWT33345.1 hypothetical protein BGI41_02870 [Methanobrevibacter sp. 87.7]
MSEDKIKVHITEALTSKKIIEITEAYPSLEIITCSKSIYNRIPKKYLSALEQLDITVKVEYNQGAKPKYSKELIEKVIKLKENGLTPKEIADIVELSTKKTYYILEKYSDIKLNNYKRKYTKEEKENIKQLKKEGLKPNKISEITNIPIRTIYYILNKK